MLRGHRLRRPALLAATALLVGGLSACGGDVVTADEPAVEGFDAFSVSGDVGRAPQVEFTERMDADDIESETLVEGDGEEIAEGDYVEVNVAFYNGFDGQELSTTYGQGGGGAQVLQITTDDPRFESLIGQRIGSRVAVIGDAEAFYGEDGLGGTQFGVGNNDSVLYVVDVMRPAEVTQGPDWFPAIVSGKGDPQLLDFSEVGEPAAELQVETLTPGEGRPVTEGDDVRINYLGQVATSPIPFDENYTQEDPQPSPVTGFVPGFTQAIVGQRIGSRVVVAIPPDLGYGEAGNPQAGIAPTDTLYFVIDILGAAPSSAGQQGDGAGDAQAE